MISKRDLLERIINLEKELLDHKPPTLSVPVVDKDGEVITRWQVSEFSGGWMGTQWHELTFGEVCKALQDMCGIEITYQEIEGSAGVVIYEKDIS